MNEFDWLLSTTGRVVFSQVYRIIDWVLEIFILTRTFRQKNRLDCKWKLDFLGLLGFI